MNIIFFYEYGEIPEIGTGHKCRVECIAKELENRGHRVEFMENKDKLKNQSILVIDHMFSQKELILRAKEKNIKVVLIDGVEDDVELSDLSISSFVNKKAQYKGIKYVAFPIYKYRDNVGSKNEVFVGLGGFDANSYAIMILDILKEIGLDVIIAKSINHPNFEELYSNVSTYQGTNYYEAIEGCKFGIVAGGLILFCMLYYGLPIIAIPQYDHQKDNINGVAHCCVVCRADKNELKDRIIQLIEDSKYRNSLSNLAKKYVDGKGVKRVCDLIEGI